MQSWSSLATSIVAFRTALRRRLPWRWAAPLGLLITGILLQRLAHFEPAIVEDVYSRGLYPFLGRAISQLSRPFNFSLAEALMATLPVAGFALVLWQTRRDLRKGCSTREIILARTRQMIWFAAIFFVTFQLLFGLNYQRQPLATGLQLSRRQATTLELENFSTHIIAEINRNYEATRPGATSERQGRSREGLFDTIETAFQATDLLGGAARGGFGRPKPVYSSGLLTSLGVSGIYSPFTGEPNYNTKTPESELPFSIAHEKAHQRGYAREDEASFIAFLVCTRSGDPFVRYSGFLQGLRVLAPLRSAVSPERYREIIDQLSPGARADLQANASFWKSARRPLLSGGAERVNSTYLRANSVGSGTGNYGEVVSLIISYYLTYPST